MSAIVWGLLAFFVRAIGFALDIMLFGSRLRELARVWTGSDKMIEVPATVKILTPAAQRALAEAERRNHFLYLPRK
ncbi:hypothetical protein CQ12_08220 [Bradyrhizobium jicamae]|uniref:Uncharacterized protein n=1 Tax=Bradyrhizobium jicamae TaxID=280332 RepID=A0A0R3LQ06_9BRAD|nr:hypothetical protein [Bradyrhizobium jicamae]KRR08942.1 hypothetical protein CQ12_08220 [Bradyrhizobium jicamae]